MVINMFPLFVIPPTVKLAAVGGSVGLVAGCVFSPLTTAIYGVIGAVQGAMGAAALTALGYNVGSLALVAGIGAAAGMAITAPFALASGLMSFVGGDKGFLPSLGRFGLNVGVMFLGSFILSTALLLGTLPAVAVAAGAAVTSVAKEAVSYAMS